MACKAAVLLLLAGILVAESRAQTLREAWVHRFDGPIHGDEAASALALAGDSLLLVVGTGENAGTGNDLLLLALRLDGTLAWHQHLDGDGSNDAGTALAVAPDGAIYAAGRLAGDAAVARYGANGKLKRVRRLNGALDGLDAAVALKPADDGTLYLLATVNQTGAAGTQDGLLARFTATGDTLWTRTIDGAGSTDLAVDLELAFGRHPVVLLRSDSSGTGSDFLIQRYSPDGSLVWHRRHGGQQNQIPAALALDEQGRVYAAGTGPGVGSDILTMAFDSLGTPLWQQNLGRRFFQ